MKYGYFDNKNKEYVIEKPNTPRSWTNYLGSTRYGAIITNNAGGYSFYKSAAQGRFMRMRFNSTPMDQPGRYIYIRDQESGDFWSNGWQPVGKPLDQYESICRHGTGYTIIESEYSDIQTKTLYFIPLNKNYEVWNFKIVNSGNETRKISLFTFVEYASHWLVKNDFLNLQYSQYTLKMDVIDNIIDQGVNVNLPYEPEDFSKADACRHSFLAISGVEVSGFDTDKDIFIGNYNSYHNPVIVEEGKCANSIAVGDNGCGTFQIDLELRPGEARELNVIMGIGRADIEGRAAQEELQKEGKVKKEFKALKKYWYGRIDNLQVKTPDEDLNNMLQVWAPYNCHITFAWSRAASLVYSGARDGLGYRDTVQDILGVIHNIPTEARKRIELMLTGQTSNGGAMPVVKPFDHHPGEEEKPAESEYRSDDCLWLFNTVPEYVKETGDIDFYNKILPYADKGEDTVLGHLKKALEFNLNRLGNNGLPCGLAADWNDCLQLGQEGESLFVSFQLRFGLKTYLEINEILKNDNEIEWAIKHLAQLDKNINQFGWDGDWYLRAIRDDGLKYGSNENEEGKIFCNPQFWSVISDHASHKKAQKALRAVNERLATQYGIIICEPYQNTDTSVVKAPLFNKGMKENASIFCHTQGWGIIAETLLGNGNNAYEYLKAYLPSVFNDKAEIREIEPYVFCQNTHSKYSPRCGASRIPWLSGTASWTYHAIMKYILGIQPEYNGININPCIPSSWNRFYVQRIFRDKKLNITVENKANVEKGVKEIRINDEIRKNTSFIPEYILKDKNNITLIIG